LSGNDAQGVVAFVGGTNGVGGHGERGRNASAGSGVTSGSVALGTGARDGGSLTESIHNISGVDALVRGAGLIIVAISIAFASRLRGAKIGKFL